MSTVIKIPAFGESITSAYIAKWHKAAGDPVTKGEILVTLETDKVSSELEAEVDGVLEITVPEGEEIAIGTVIGAVDGSGAAATPAESAPAETPAVSPDPAPEAEAAPAASGVKSAPDGGATAWASDVAEKSRAPAAEAPGAAAAAPADPKPAAAPAPVVVSTPAPEGRTTRKRLSPLRRKIANQLVSAQHEAALLTTFNECDMSGVMKLRKDVQEKFVATYGVKLGFMSFFVKAVVEGLKEVTSVNAQIEGDEVVQNHFYDIGVAVGTEKGLVVPVIRDCDKKTFAEIEQDIIDFATRARDGKIAIEELQGGVFTISNGGIYGSLLSTPIVNPPQSGILGMHTIQKRPVAVENDEIEVRPMMYLALSYDHRIVDGKEAVTFLLKVKDCIENPARLLVGA